MEHSGEELSHFGAFRPHSGRKLIPSLPPSYAAIEPVVGSPEGIYAWPMASLPK
jgi:hypothetical protein